MLLEGKKNRILVGYDLGLTYAQISYCIPDEEPVTIPSAFGVEQYNIPVVLLKEKVTNQWYYGKEALAKAKEGAGSLVRDLVLLARKQEPVMVGGESYEPTALLALFMKRSLSLLNTAVTEKIEGFMITTDTLDTLMVDILTSCIGIVQLKTKAIYFLSYSESIYRYMIHQPQELFKNNVLVCDFREDGLFLYSMECNHKTSPVVAFIHKKEYPGFREISESILDEAFLKVLRENMSSSLVSSVYLIGEKFRGEWNKESLRYLCMNRRVFQGNNLFSKGACYAVSQKLYPNDAGRDLVFLGDDKLKVNVGMKVLRRGEDSYFALLDAGGSWFEAKRKCEIILESGNCVSILLMPLTGGASREVEMVLEGLPKREKRMTRLLVAVKMISERELHLELEDLGFGEIVPATHKKWQETYLIQ